MKKILILVISILIARCSFAQGESMIKFSGYLETYYGYDFNKPVDNNRPGFVYSHNRHNEVNLNLGYIKGAFDNGTTRANLALMSGTYSNANLAAEPELLKNIFEANAGMKLSRNANLWVDAGIFASHIGFESAISKDCWTLTRNISSENTPYYESGVKLSYGSENNRLTITALYLNGWQRITRLEGNSQPAGGLQLNYRPTDRITLNYSGYIGTEGADEVRVRRIYNNFYGIFQLTRHFDLVAGLDFGTQQISRDEGETNKVVSPVAIARYRFRSNFAMAGRVEYYKDLDGIFIATDNPGGFQTTGYSLNLDYMPIPKAVVRFEGKLYESKSSVFLREGSPVRDNVALTASFAVSL